MSRTLQRLLLAIGALAFIVLIVEIALSLLATIPGETPARVMTIDAGPYQLTFKQYKDPANAGFALPFSLAPQQAVNGELQYTVTSEPIKVTGAATAIQATLTPDSQIANGIQGTAEISVQGQWILHIVVNGPLGRGEGSIPINAVAPPPVPSWIGWPVGLIPLCGLILFLIFQRGRRQSDSQQRTISQTETVPTAP